MIEKTKIVSYAIATLLVIGVMAFTLNLLQQTNSLWSYCKENYGEEIYTVKPMFVPMPNTCGYLDENGFVHEIELRYVNGEWHPKQEVKLND